MEVSGLAALKEKQDQPYVHEEVRKSIEDNLERLPEAKEEVSKFDLHTLKKEVKQSQEESVWKQIFSNESKSGGLWKRKYLYPFGSIAPKPDFYQSVDNETQPTKILTSSSAAANVLASSISEVSKGSTGVY